MKDEYNLQRFISAQDALYDDAIEVLRRGAMCTPYMEVIFPRLASESSSLVAQTYAITSIDEARAYLSSQILGGRYRQCVATLQRVHDLGARAVFGEVDAKKLHASLTLFSEAAGEEFLLETMFDVWFDGLVDEETMIRLAGMH